ncbi:MAG: beta-N-acetylhexosaminidase [Anaerolineae bacterium]|nr:beta-N-acetylhexosaminidase [Anaerolineae bacterium]
MNIIPKPAKLVATGDRFELKPNTVIVANKAARAKASQLAAALRAATGLILPLQDEADTPAIQLTHNPALAAELGQEGYHLNISAKGVEIEAAGEAGLFYGGQTLLQLLPTQGEGYVPGVQITDVPRFGWRGLHVDVGRHFMPLAALKRMIDALALHKLNIFHWHLTEDQGWRLEIKKYPRLTEVGAWRKRTRVAHEYDPRNLFDDVPHGGFYTQDEARELVAYAAARHITVVPEIEMPGHAQAAVAAYPELGNADARPGTDPLDVCERWGIHKHVFNVEDSTIAFLQDVLTEVMAIFPSPFIHVGGDECPKDEWKASPRAQARMRELDLADEHELQSWFIRQMDTFITQHGRRLVGWDEILEGGLAPNATVMSWRGESGGITAAKAGHDVVMAPTTYVYFDYYQSADKAAEPLAIGGLLTLDKGYGYEPIPAELTATEAKHVLGAQAQLWTEYIKTPAHLEYMAFPRLCALAEVLWSPAASKNYADFLTRLPAQRQRLAALGVNYRNG